MKVLIPCVVFQYVLMACSQKQTLEIGPRTHILRNTNSGAGSFSDFPSEFQSRTTKIIVSRSLKTHLAAPLAQLLLELNKSSSHDNMFIPNISYADEIKKVFKGNIIALLGRNDSFIAQFKNAPIRYDKKFMLYKIAGKQDPFTVKDFASSSLAQIFREEGRSVLLITAMSDSSLSLASLYNVIRSFNNRLTSLESNVCIADSAGRYFFCAPIANKLLFYEQPANNGKTFFYRNKYLLMAASLILVLLGFVIVNHKVKQAQSILYENN